MYLNKKELKRRSDERILRYIENSKKLPKVCTSSISTRFLSDGTKVVTYS